MFEGWERGLGEWPDRFLEMTYRDSGAFSAGFRCKGFIVEGVKDESGASTTVHFARKLSSTSASLGNLAKLLLPVSSKPGEINAEIADALFEESTILTAREFSKRLRAAESSR